MREMAGVTTLRLRRIEAADKFAAKCLASTRFAAWFPKKTTARRSARGGGGEEDREEYARCNRLRDSPIFYLRRRLNGKAGKMYGVRNQDYRDAPGAGQTNGRTSIEMNQHRVKK